MKYLLYFKENNNDFNKDIIFEGKNWMVVEPSSDKSLSYWIEDADFPSYRNLDDIYIAIDKDSLENKYFFNFKNEEFYESDGNEFYIRNFFDKNSDVDNPLYTFFGERLECENVIEENGEWWLVVEDYPWFSDFFKADRNTRDDFFKKVLSGDAFDIFSYNLNDFKIDENIDVNEDNLILLKVVLLLEKDRNDYDYDIEEIKNYSDVVDIVEEYSIEELEKILRSAIREAHEGADSDEAWRDIVDSIYNSFNLDEKSAKWSKYKNSKNSFLWIKFLNKDFAIDAKYRIMNINNEWDDDYYVDYSTPYYGYSASGDEVEEFFNNCLEERVCDYQEIEYNEINDLYELWDKLKDNLSESEILNEINIRLEAKRYNL